MIKRLIDLISFAFFYFFKFISILLSQPLRVKFGGFIGYLLRILSKKRKDITLNNIMLIYPDKSQIWIRDLMKSSYKNLGIAAVEILILNKINKRNLDDYIRYENIELIHELYNEGRGLILMSGHYGNWELLAYSAGIYTGYPITIIVKQQSNNYIDKIINKYRTSAGNRIITMDMAAKEVINTIQQKKIVAMLADQSPFGGKGLYVDFMGLSTLTFASPAIIALKYDVPIIIGFAEREVNNLYKVKLTEVKHDDLKYNEDGVKELTQRHVKILEDAIRSKPELWAWQHRRWKDLQIMN